MERTEPAGAGADAAVADEALVERIGSLDAGQRHRFRLELFAMDLDMAGLLWMRLGEHAIHTWDIAVALDPAATVAPDAVALLVDTLGQLVTRSCKPDGTQLRLLVSATSPQRRFILESAETVTLTPADGAESIPELRLTDAGAQSLPELRLPVGGRALRPALTLRLPGGSLATRRRAGGAGAAKWPV